MSYSTIVITIVMGVFQLLWGVFYFLLKDKMKSSEKKFTQLFKDIADIKEKHATIEYTDKTINNLKEENKDAHKELREDVNNIERRMLNGK